MWYVCVGMCLCVGYVCGVSVCVWYVCVGMCLCVGYVCGVSV